MTGYRFASPELLQLGRPPALASEPFSTLLDRNIQKLVQEFSAAGIPYAVEGLITDPGHLNQRVGVWRDFLRRQAIDDAVAQTYLGSATGIWLDLRAADYGVVRLSGENDERLRLRARLAWEALSVAGPAGAYVFHAMEAHPDILAATAYGPESGIIAPGEVLVILQSSVGSGVPAVGIVDSVSARLDAHEIRYSTGAVRFRTVRDEQSVRPLGDRVIVEACQVRPFYVDAVLRVRPGPDPEIIRVRAIERLTAYLEQRRRIGREVPRSALIAALHLADANGLPIIEDVELLQPTQDVVPAHNEVAAASTVAVNVEVR